MTVEQPIAGRAVGSGTPLRYLPRPIRIAKDPLESIGVGWLTAFTGTMILALIADGAFPDARLPEFDLTGLQAILALVVVSPVVETLIMGVVLMVLVRILPPVVAIALSAVGWGIAHALVAPVWGMVIWWPFLVFSTLFVSWQNRSLLLAFAIPMAVHALHNFLPALLVARGLVG